MFFVKAVCPDDRLPYEKRQRSRYHSGQKHIANEVHANEGALVWSCTKVAWEFSSITEICIQKSTRSRTTQNKDSMTKVTTCIIYTYTAPYNISKKHSSSMAHTGERSRIAARSPPPLKPDGGASRSYSSRAVARTVDATDATELLPDAGGLR